MKFRKIKILPENNITHEIFCTEMPSADYLDILIMRFSGTYGDGCCGNGDAEYMAAISQAAISFTGPFGIIYDLTDLSYQWGDMMTKVIHSHSGRDEEMPMAIVVSDKCEKAIRSLLRDEIMATDLSCLHHSVDAAVAHVDQEYQAAKSARTPQL